MRRFWFSRHGRWECLPAACGLALLAVLLPTTLAAQAPDWSVDASQYEHTLTATVAVDAGGAPVADSGDVLGAFVGGTVRGLAQPDTSAGAGGLYFLSVYGNEAGQDVSFRVYDSSADTVRQAERTLAFQPDATYGTPSSPFRLAIGDAELPGVARWIVSPAAHEQTMTVTATVFVEPHERASDGPADRVAAFVSGEVRGVAEAEQIGTSPSGNENVFFLTVYGDPPDAGRALTLRYYDAANDRVYPTQDVDLSFHSNAVEGTPSEPVSVVARRPQAEVEGALELGGIAPQPLGRSTVVTFASSRTGRARLVLYDALGRRVRVLFEGRVEKNQTYRRRLRVADLASGTYWLRLAGTRSADTRPVVVVH